MNGDAHLNNEQQLTNILLTMIEEDQIPLSISEDVHHILSMLQNGETKITDLNYEDPILDKTIQEAKAKLQNT